MDFLIWPYFDATSTPEKGRARRIRGCGLGGLCLRNPSQPWAKLVPGQKHLECCPCPPRSPEDPRNSSRSKVGPKVGLRAVPEIWSKVGQSTQNSWTFWPAFYLFSGTPLKRTFGPTFDLLEFLGFSGPLRRQGQHKKNQEKQGFGYPKAENIILGETWKFSGNPGRNYISPPPPPISGQKAFFRGGGGGTYFGVRVR